MGEVAPLQFLHVGLQVDWGLGNRYGEGRLVEELAEDEHGPGFFQFHCRQELEDALPTGGIHTVMAQLLMLARLLQQLLDNLLGMGPFLEKLQDSHLGGGGQLVLQVHPIVEQIMDKLHPTIVVHTAILHLKTVVQRCVAVDKVFMFLLLKSGGPGSGDQCDQFMCQFWGTGTVREYGAE